MVIGDGNELETQWKSLFGMKVNPIIKIRMAKMKIVSNYKANTNHLKGFGTIMSAYQFTLIKESDPYVNFSFE